MDTQPLTLSEGPGKGRCKCLMLYGCGGTLFCFFVFSSSEPKAQGGLL